MTINYELMKKAGPGQKAALTRALKAKDPAKMIEVCRRAVEVWNEAGAWPDNWSRWQRALDDVCGWQNAPRLEDL